jgi:hypothetical protein
MALKKITPSSNSASVARSSHYKALKNSLLLFYDFSDAFYFRSSTTRRTTTTIERGEKKTIASYKKRKIPVN